MANIYGSQGTAVVWKSSGGDHAITLTSLANNTGRKGVTHDWTASFPLFTRVELITKFGTGPTAGKTIDLWWASSADNSVFDGQLASADAAQNDFSLVYQLHFIGSMPVLNNTSAQSKSFIFRLPARYGFPVVMNNATGQSLSATAGDHTLTFLPIYENY